jgi:hypothetical protein
MRGMSVQAARFPRPDMDHQLPSYPSYAMPFQSDCLHLLYSSLGYRFCSFVRNPRRQLGRVGLDIPIVEPQMQNNGAKLQMPQPPPC